MDYVLIIGNEVELNGGENIITDVKVSIFEDDNKAAERSDWLYNTVEISGQLTKDSKDNVKKIFEWSQKTKREDVYQKVEIIAKEGQEKIRKYTLPQMFCHSYTESFSEFDHSESSIGQWHLVLKQLHQKQCISQIQVES